MSVHRKVISVAVGLLTIGMAVAPALTAGAQAVNVQAPAATSVSAAVPTVAKICAGTSFGPPGVGLHWGVWNSSNCVHGGFPGMMLTYNWYVPNVARSAACVQVEGFKRVLPKPGAGHFVLFPNLVPKLQWQPDLPRDVRTAFSGGCGRRGSVTVPWNNVLSYPRLRVSTLGVVGTIVNFTP